MVSMPSGLLDPLSLSETESASEGEPKPKCPRQCMHHVFYRDAQDVDSSQGEGEPKPKCPRQCMHHVFYRDRIRDAQFYTPTNCMDSIPTSQQGPEADEP